MTGLISAITAGYFPGARLPRRKNDFSHWLSEPAVNSNSRALTAPMLSLEDEIMLARLRSVVRPVRGSHPYMPYTQGAETAPQHEQYVFDFMVEPLKAGTLFNESF